MPLVSIIMPSYNRAALLPATLATVLAQEFLDYELLVVDDGSTDATPAVVEAFSRQARPGVVRYLRQEQAGTGAARNRGIFAARGEYCAFLDSDDLYFPWSLAVVAQAIEEGSGPSVVVGRAVRFSTMPAFNSVARQPAHFSAWQDLYEYGAHHELGPCGILVARTQVLRDVGGFITRRMVGEDSELMIRLGTAPGLIQIEAPALFGYRHHLDNFTRDPEPWYEGANEVLRRYRQGTFPGGRARKHRARHCAADLITGFSMVCLFNGRPRLCADLYWRSLLLQIRAGEMGHVLKTPPRLLLHALGRWPSPAFKAYIEGLSP